MEVILKHHTPLWVASEAIRTAWDSGEKSDSLHDVWACSECSWLEEKYLTPMNGQGQVSCPECGSPDVYHMDTVLGKHDLALIERVGNKFKHSSTLEHLSYNFQIKGISRACLQELARHRIASLTVKSTRYTLKELKNKMILPSAIQEWCVIPPNMTPVQENKFRMSMVSALGDVVSALNVGQSNDVVKFLLPESYKTELAWTINARSLQNFLSLRSDKSAMWEIRKLANQIFDALPDDHKYLFTDYMKKEK